MKVKDLIKPEMVELVKEAVEKVKEGDGRAVYQVPKKVYDKFCKKFFDLKPETMKQVALAKSAYLNVSAKVLADKVAEENLDVGVLRTNTETGTAAVKIKKKKEFTNPKTGEKIIQPEILFIIRSKYIVDNEIKEELKEKIKSLY